MGKISKAIYRLILLITGSIAFLPTIITLLFFLLALFIWYFEGTVLSAYLESQIPVFKNLKEDTENARLLLNILASGTITLMVFSFSMVMLVINQASSNLSPRVIPGLISNKFHQVVLGVNVGTIIYTLLLIISFKPGKTNGAIPVIGILLGLIFGIFCLILFVIFIHSISQSIQVNTIIKRIYVKAIREFKNLGEISVEDDTDQTIAKQHDWYVFKSVESGYLRRIQQDKLLAFACSHDLVVQLMVPLGAFLVAGMPFLKFSRDVSQLEDLKDQMISCFIFSMEEMVMPDYEYNFRHISEIAVKALSPGINDPGTAISAVDLMTLLFAERLKAKEKTYLYDKKKQVRIMLMRSSVDELLFYCLAPVRTYGKADVMIILKLMTCLHTLMLLDKSRQHYLPDLVKHLRAILHDADKAIDNPEDRLQVNKMLYQIKQDMPAGDLSASLMALG